MVTRLRLGVIGLLVLVVIAGAASFGPAGAQETDTANGNVTITVGSTGAVTAPPDLAVIDLAVEASAPSAQAARDMVSANVSQVRDALADANVTDDQVRTTFFSIRAEHDENGSVTYHAVHGLEVRVPVDDAGMIVDTVTDAGATRVDGVRFTLTEETRRDLRDDALRAALSNARADADVIAEASGVEVDTVVSVETADGGVGPVFAEARQEDGTMFDPGPVTVTASVTVTYRAR